MLNFLLSLTDTKFLIATGWNSDGDQTHSEMIDLTVKGESHCSNWAEIPKGLIQATGGVIEDTILICGGYQHGIEGSSSDECYRSVNFEMSFWCHHFDQNTN